MHYWFVPLQVSRVTLKYQEIDNTPVPISCGSVGQQTANMERGFPPEEWKIAAGSISSMCHTNSCFDGSELPPKTIAALEKICHGFRCAKRDAHDSNCSVTWAQVCTPRWAGGLGIPNLQWLNAALEARWLWLRHTDRQRPASCFGRIDSFKAIGYKTWHPTSTRW